MNGSVTAALRSWFVAVAFGALACGDAQTLCDGSDEIRWAASGFAGRPYLPPFVRENGALRITIDGQCQFSLHDESLRGLRRGEIDPQRARVLADTLHAGSYARFAEYEGHICLDGTEAWVADGTATLSLTCVSVGDSDAPPGLASLDQRVHDLARELDAISEYVWRPVQIQVLPAQQSTADVLNGQPVYDWNAPLDLAALVLDYADYPGELPTAGVAVEDEETLARLDELRRIDIAADDAGDFRPIELGLRVRDVQGRLFQVLVRDEPSEAVRRGWDVLFDF